jgi:hypothetical protein
MIIGMKLVMNFFHLDNENTSDFHSVNNFQYHINFKSKLKESLAQLYTVYLKYVC